MTLSECRKWFEYQLKERWMVLNEDEQEIYNAAIMAIDELEDLRKSGKCADVERCKLCQCSKTGEGYGEVPPPIGYDYECDECEIAKRIRSLNLNDKEKRDGTV